jgi:hypothetical protein
MAILVLGVVGLLVAFTAWRGGWARRLQVTAAFVIGCVVATTPTGQWVGTTALGVAGKVGHTVSTMTGKRVPQLGASGR